MTRVEAERVGWALDRSRRAGVERVAWREGLRLRLEVEGVVGVGEACPLPGYSDETLADVERAIDGLSFPTRLAPTASRWHEAVQVFSAAPPSLRFALEVAFLHACASASGVTVDAFLGAPRGYVGRPAMMVEDDDDVAVLIDHFGRDDRAVKLKIGPELATDLGRAARVRALAPLAELRLDANRQLGWSELEAASASLEALRPLLLEEPVGSAGDADRAAARRLFRDLPTLALDESLRTLGATEIDAWLAEPALGALVLKPTTLGLAGALDLAARAFAAGKRALLSHAHEGPIGRRALDALAPCFRDASPGLSDPSLPALRVLEGTT